MTPGGRIQAAIEALDFARMESRPADRVLHDYFRDRRFIGGKDRRAITEMFWGAMRNRARLASDCAIAEGRNVTDAQVRAESGRRLMIALCVAEKVANELDLALFTGEAYAPVALDKREVEWVTAMRQVKASDRPEWAWAETPEWLWPRFQELYAGAEEAEIKAARTEASVDLRINTLKAERSSVALRLSAEGVATEPMRFSPWGLRCTERSNVAATQAFQEGWVEVQDESAQLAALLVGAKPGESVVDFCAGAGGKTLALAAAMNNSGRLTACDISQARLDRGAVRLRRAGAFNVTRRALASESDKWVKRHKETYDRVMVDAPCSGSGTWRRNPDARWRTTPEDLAQLQNVQARILNSAARLVRPGGRLVYATCSMFSEENEAQVETFLAARDDFALLPVAAAWPENLGPVPAELAEMRMLRLTPGRHGTDGFFVAVMERAAKPDEAELEQGETA
jgi:16S rRNA (cytosine967-C5)-methyltransferase